MHVHQGVHTQSGRAQNILWRAPGHSDAERTCTEHSAACTTPRHSAAEWACTEHSFQILTQNRTAEHHIIRFLKSRRNWGSFRCAVSSMAVGKNPPVQSAPLDLSRHTGSFLGAMVVHLPRTSGSFPAFNEHQWSIYRGLLTPKVYFSD